jgi:hypothetical protein
MEYADLTATDIAKQINDEYAVILNSERANLQRALAIGEKLMHLRSRIPRSEWKIKLEGYCPDLSYETATLYIRLYENQEVWRAAAVAKNVEPTSLTIDAARQLLAKPRSKAESEDDDEDNAGDGKPSAKAMEANNAEAEARELADVDIDGERQERVDWIFGQLKKRYPQDELLELTERLAKHLDMKLIPAEKDPGPTGSPLPVQPLTAKPIERRF